METKDFKLERVGFTLLALALLGVLAYWVFSTQLVSGSAPSGLPASNASTSRIVVTAGTVIEPVATSTTCSSRVVATASTSVMIHIGDAVPTATLGYWEGASSTSAFDGGIYGCGALKVYPFSTGAITVTETN